ncbi:MAG: hypothetical protein WBF33_27775 [Candidatus Nitrosopolaris sp.]|jgi:hypothetical protein
MTLCILDTIATFAPGDCEGCGRLLQPRQAGKVDLVENYGAVGLKICYKCYIKIIYTPKTNSILEERRRRRLQVVAEWNRRHKLAKGSLKLSSVPFDRL